MVGPLREVAVAERAVEHFYATINRPQLADVLSAPNSVDATDIDTALASVQIYGRCTDDERRLLNHVLFRRYTSPTTASTDYEPPDGDARGASHTSPTSHDTFGD